MMIYLGYNNECCGFFLTFLPSYFKVGSKNVSFFNFAIYFNRSNLFDTKRI